MAQASRFQRVVDFLGLQAQHRRPARHGHPRRHGRAHGRAVPAALPARLGRRRSSRVGLLTAWTTCSAALYSFPGGYLSRPARHQAGAAGLQPHLDGRLPDRDPHPDLAGGARRGGCSSSPGRPSRCRRRWSLVAKVLPKNKRTMGVSVHSLVRRVPMALGPVVGGAFIDDLGRAGRASGWPSSARWSWPSSRPCLQQVLIEDDARRRRQRRAPRQNPLRLWREMTARLCATCSSRDILVRFCEQIPVRLRRHLGCMHDDRARPSPRCSSACSARDRDGHGDAHLHPRCVPGRPRQQEAVRR